MKRERFFLYFLVWLIPVFASAQGESESSLSFGVGKFHITADRTLYHSNVKVHEAFGHVVMNAEERRLSSDYAWIDTKTGDVKARGNVVFVSSLWTIQAAEIHFNMNTGNGSIFYGSVSNDTYRLRGQLIRKISDNRFLTTEGEYTTCKDCPESWKMSARTVDMTVDGYAFMEDVYVIIKDVPTVYLPYMIMPVKNRRQTGFLFPRISTGSRNGFSYVQPFFVAIDDHQDATLAYGRYSKRGRRGEVQYRYRSYDGIQGFMNGFYVQDRDYKPNLDRYALQTEHHLPLAKYFDMRVRVNETKDRDYAVAFQEDVSGVYLPAMESNIVASSNLEDFFISAEAKRYRSLINRDPMGFDKDMVQVGPSVYLGVRERKIYHSIMANIFASYDRFYREGGPFFDANHDNIFQPFSKDRVREVQRLQIAPEISTSFNLGNAVDITPSIQYNERLHFFNPGISSSPVGDLNSRYILGRVEATTSLERVYKFSEDSTVDKIKHKLTPVLAYSNIPWSQETPNHPFSFQAKQPGGIFDQFDVIPVNNRRDDLREPIGNAISFGFYSRLIRKNKNKDSMLSYPYDFVVPKKKKYDQPKNKKQEISIEKSRLWDEYSPEYDLYKQIWLLSVNESYDINEAKRGFYSNPPPAPFSPLLVRSVLSLDNFNKYLEYQYKPYAKYIESQNRYEDQHDLKVNGEYIFKSLINPKGTLFFKRSINSGFEVVTSPNPSRKISFGFTWSFNDFFSITYGRQFDLLNKKRIAEIFTSVYNSPSECWQLKFNYNLRQEVGSEFGIDLALNLMGTGYIGVNQQGGGGVGGSPQTLLSEK